MWVVFLVGFFRVDVGTFINAVLHRCFSCDMSCFKIMLFCFCLFVFARAFLFVHFYLYIFMNTVSTL